MLDKEEDVKNFTSSNSLKRMLESITQPINESNFFISFSFIQKFCQLINKLVKKKFKDYIMPLNIPEYFFTTIMQITNYLMNCNNCNLESHLKLKDFSLNIIQNATCVMEALIGEENMMSFFVGQK